MKVSRAADGDHKLACGVLARIVGGRQIMVFCDKSYPPREAVEAELLALTGLRTWLDNWPESVDLYWSGWDSDAVVLDYDERIARCSDLVALTTILHEIVERGVVPELGWGALGIDPDKLPTFGGDEPTLPASFFDRWKNESELTLPPRALSWDEDRILVSAATDVPPCVIPRRPRSVFLDDVPPSDDDAFTQLACMLPWASSAYQPVGSNRIVQAHDVRDGRAYELPYGALISSRTREVIAVGNVVTLHQRFGQAR